MLPKSFLFFLLLLPLVTCTPKPSPSPSPELASPDENATEFIRARCAATRYPDLCFTSLSGYADAVRGSPLQLARVAANVTLARLRDLSAHVSALSPVTGREAAALWDCKEELGNAADQVNRTSEELRRLQSVEESSEVAWRVSNAQTWMSAALTAEDTCSDGFQAVAGGVVKADVVRRVGRVKEYTSNALALLNDLVDGR